MRSRVFMSAVCFAVLVFMGAAHGAHACVGKTLVIGSVSSPDMVVTAEMMAVLITERTGTTVVVKYYGDYQGCYDAVKKGDVDIILDYTGRAYLEVLGKSPEKDAAKVFQAVKDAYQRDMNLVWLEPFGFSDSARANKGDTPAMAAPVVKKETLNKFPALPRVINKLAGKLDNGVMAKLAADSDGGKNAKKITRKFLKDKRLI